MCVCVETSRPATAAGPSRFLQCQLLRRRHERPGVVCVGGVVMSTGFRVTGYSQRDFW